MPTMTVYTKPETRALLDELSRRYPGTSYSELIRMALELLRQRAEAKAAPARTHREADEPGGGAR